MTLNPTHWSFNCFKGKQEQSAKGKSEAKPFHNATEKSCTGVNFCISDGITPDDGVAVIRLVRWQVSGFRIELMCVRTRDAKMLSWEVQQQNPRDN